MVRKSSCFYFCTSLLYVLLTGKSFSHHPHDVANEIVLNPAYPQDQTVFLSSLGSMNLFLKSENKGLSWSNIRSGQKGYKVFGMKVTSNWESSKTLYAVLGSGGLQRSRDGGKTWDDPLDDRYVKFLDLSDVRGDAAQFLIYGNNQQLRLSGDGGHTSEGIFTPENQVKITAVSMHRYFSETNVIVAGLSNNQIIVSHDRGQTWQFSEIQGIPTSIVIPDTYAENGTFYVGTHGAGVLKSIDRGISFSRINNGLDDMDVNDLVIPQNAPSSQHMYAATRDAGVYFSDNSGKNWSLTSLTVPKTIQTNNHHLALALSANYPKDPTIFCATFEGLYISNDMGKNWYESNINPTRIGRKIDISPDFRQDKTIFVSRYGNPLAISNDGGANWEQRVTNLNSMSSYALSVSPEYQEDSQIILGTAYGIKRSIDNGKSWQQHKLLPPTEERKYWPYEVRQISFSPDFSHDRSLFAVNSGGIYKSVDAGETWEFWSSTPAIYTSNVAISPDYKNDRVLFLGGQTLHRSGNDGVDWSDILVRGKIESIIPAPDMADSGEVFTISRENGFYISTDKGESWRQMDGALDHYSPSAMRLSPNFELDDTIYVSTLSGGFYISENRGREWRRVSSLGSPVDTVYDFVISPNFADDKKIFAVTYDGVFESKNAGLSWNQLTSTEFFDDARDPWILRGKGWTGHSYEKSYVFGTHKSRTEGEKMTLPFTGTGVRLYGVLGPDQGIAEIMLDGKVVDVFDGYADSYQYQQLIYENTEITWGFHDLTVRIKGNKNPLSTNGWVSIDGAEVVYQKHDYTPILGNMENISLAGDDVSVGRDRKGEDKAAKE